MVKALASLLSSALLGLTQESHQRLSDGCRHVRKQQSVPERGAVDKERPLQVRNTTNRSLTYHTTWAA